MLERLLSRWRGVALTLFTVVATVWLSMTGGLSLYIHPRYFVFTSIMAVIGGVLAIAAIAVTPGRDDHDHGHDHDHSHESDALGTSTTRRSNRRPRLGARQRIAVIASMTVTLVVVATAFVALIIAPPVTLSSAAVENRSLNANAQTVDSPISEGETLRGRDTSSFTVKDWAAMLRQGDGEQQVLGERAKLVGFVTEDPDSPDAFILARFVVNCCAIDAAPVGVAVHQPGWQGSYPVDSWVEVDGAFVTNPSASSAERVALMPTTITAIDQPNDPYVY
ncbi:TIGR03943 family putative permease subunit [Pseudoclavibacter sp. Z016]|uniref:TIGR03943 family putative permease subunit n=1 Tax=Pseudoclavibacter sp. Z016 TaxID=2080581 RepID=UPI000CE87B7E|nr:TIGR03943 family protein [Pseudoclavibacter sp. Z016]PPF76396.1 TIGR03943 family protein [Pseudoclavibacter sp. Z016]